MKIRDIFQKKEHTLSFEIFPPNDNVSLKEVMHSASKMTAQNPDFMSVTYKAQGGSGDHTVQISATLNDLFGIPAIAHLTGTGATKEEIDTIIEEMKKQNVENILVLRGDIPTDRPFPTPEYYEFAYQMVERIHTLGDFSLGAAIFPEGQSDTLTLDEEIIYLKEKIDYGVDFLTTQMFFDNEAFFRFYDKLLAQGIETPILAGIMPITNERQIHRITTLSGASIPKSLERMIDSYGNDPAAALEVGCLYAANQIAELLTQGVKGAHIYTMNNPLVAEKITSMVESFL